MIPPPSSCPKCGRDTHCDDGKVSRCYRCASVFAAGTGQPSLPAPPQKKRSVQVPVQPCPWCGVLCGCEVDDSIVSTESGAEMWSGTHVGLRGCKKRLRLWVSPRGVIGLLERDQSHGLTVQPLV